LNNKPLKRHKALHNLSREHHDGLVFALRLQKGVAKKAMLKAMDDYARWFWDTHLKLHFEMEEAHLFPKFGLEQTLVKTAIDQHRKLKKLIQMELKSYNDFKDLYTSLQTHIRLEERELFMRIQVQLNKKELAEFQNIHTSQNSCENW
jgi:uncharacterized protein YjaZ